MFIAKRYWLFIGLSVIAVVAVLLMPRFGQEMSFHSFGDLRGIWGIPNFWNVMSNVPFLLIASIGMRDVFRARVSVSIRIIYAILFAGVFLTGLGSAWYHHHPDNDTLVWDRMPMTVVFMSLFGATIAELISERVGLIVTLPLVVAGIASVVWWHMTEKMGHGDLRMYMLIQFYPMVAIPYLLYTHYSPSIRPTVVILVWVVVWYVIAKLLERFDDEVYRYLPISGHSLKHLAAAVSTAYFVRLFRVKHVGAD